MVCSILRRCKIRAVTLDPPSPQDLCASAKPRPRHPEWHHIFICFEPQGSQQSDMLRYRPSQEFSPTTIPSQNTALVTYKLPELAVNQQSPDEPGIDTALIHRNAKAAVRQTNLRSLLDFARWANDRDRASVSLDRFLQQVQHERDEAEAALKKQTTVGSLYGHLRCEVSR